MMETRLSLCANCGAELDPVSLECLYCAPAADALPSAEATAAAPREVAVTDGRDRTLGLALFEAEECLARGAAEKALVLASRAVRERPDSLTARALLERARRELLRGRRREKLESKLREAQERLGAGEVTAAERIVGSALKLVPDHPLAQELLGEIRRRRLGAGTVEAEAERELLGLARTQARQALEAARAALASGWSGKALLALRRGLRLVPDDPELLALLRAAQGSLATRDRERARRTAMGAQIRAGLDHLSRGRIDESLRILRAVLHEDPDNARAQAAIQEVRRVWLAGVRQPGETSATVPRPAGPAAHAPAAVPVPAATANRAPTARPPAARHDPRTSPARVRPSAAPAGARATIPEEIRIRPTGRRGTPLALVLLGAAGIAALVLVLGRGGGATRSATSRASPVTGPSAAGPETRSAPGPLDLLDVDLRRTLEATLAAYARALERADAELLARARPDLTASERAARMVPFVGALNAATDIRVLDVELLGDEVVVPILCTDVILGGPGPRRAPFEETLRFVRRRGTWSLDGPQGP